MALPIAALAAPVVIEIASHALKAVSIERSADIRSREIDLEERQIEFNSIRLQAETALRSQRNESDSKIQNRMIDLEFSKLERRHQLACQSLELAKHAYDKKLDLLFSAFERTSELVSRELEAIRNEQTELTSLMRDASDFPSLSSQLITRKSELSKESSDFRRLLKITHLDLTEKTALAELKVKFDRIE